MSDQKDQSSLNTRNRRTRRLTLWATAGFFFFLLWIIYIADSGQDSIFFKPAEILPYGDKIGHVLLFGLLTFGVNAALGFRTLRFRKITRHRSGHTPRWNQYHPWCSSIQSGTLLVFCFVKAEELSQYFIPSRTLDLLDFIADVFGICLFTWISSKAAEKT